MEKSRWQKSMWLNWIKKYHLALLITLAIVVRLLILFAGSGIFFFEQTGQIHGSTAYDEYAQNLIHTGVYGREAGIADSNIPPLYSFVLASVYAVFGRGGLQVGLLHIALDAVTIALVYAIVRRLFVRHGVWIAALTALFYAFYPYLIFQNLSLNDTALFMMLMYTFILLMIVLRERESLDRRTVLIAILAGLILGITTLTRALLPLFALLTAIWFLFRLSLKETFLRLLPVALVSVSVLIPWMIRSYRIYDSFVAVALNTGDNLYQGANEMTVPLFRAGYDVQWSQPPPERDPDNWFRNNQMLLDAGMEYLRTYPERIPELLWVKFWVYWSVDITPRNNPLAGQSLVLDESRNLLVLNDSDSELQDIDTIATYSGTFFDRVGRPVHILYFGGLLLLALVGIGLSWREWRTVSLLWFLQMSMTIMYLIFHPSTRYRAPTDPLLFVFSAYTLVIIGTALLARRRSKTPLRL
ncbi:MAG: glycosyltransferase family 39 protein [Anaerolineae bacterium]|nr:glycosyltransferase family 39 protein [Anaerolineae bacterium]